MTEAKSRSHEVVLQQIEADLLAGRLAIGERLLGERALAEQLGVSRASVREAIRVLEAIGIVRTGVGSGPDAGAVIVALPATAFGASLRFHLASSHLEVKDIVASRVLLESWAVQVAAMTARDSLGDALQHLDAMDEPNLSPEEFHRLDAEFHIELTRLAGNAVITTVMTALRQSIHGYVLAAVPLLPDWPATSRRLRREHRRILTAVRSGDGAGAAALLTSHIEGFYRLAGLDRG